MQASQKKQSNRVGVLCVHGFLGSPREYEPLLTALHQRGYSTGTITLPGHGGAPSVPLAQVTANSLLEHCLADFEAFARQCDAVVMVGHSLGGLCTLLTAAEQPEKLAGVVSYSAPYEHAYTVNRPHGWWEDWMPGSPATIFDTGPARWHALMTAFQFLPESFTGLDRPGYTPWLWPALWRESDQLLGRLRQRLPDVTQPTLVAHSRYDLTVPYGEMEKLVAVLSQRRGVAARLQTHTFDRCGHQIFPGSLERDRAIQLILDFLALLFDSTEAQPNDHDDPTPRLPTPSSSVS